MLLKDAGSNVYTHASERASDCCNGQTKIEIQVK